MPERLRRARPDEADALTALSHRSKASWGYPPELMERFLAELEITPEHIRNGEVWVVEDGGTCLGVCRLSLGDVAVIEDLWVEPSAMGRGHGRRLWDHVVEVARSAGAGAIELNADPNAVAFYERMGARVVGATPSTAVAGRSLPRMRIDLR